MLIMSMRMRLTKSWMKLEEKNWNKNNINKKVSQLMKMRIQLMMIWKFKPFEDFGKQLGVILLEDIFAEVENEKNVDVIDKS